jgi:hypothetical protein
LPEEIERHHEPIIAACDLESDPLAIERFGRRNGALHHIVRCLPRRHAFTA